MDSLAWQLAAKPITHIVHAIASTRMGGNEVQSRNAALDASAGIRQSPRGDKLTDPIFGPSGTQLRLN